MKVYHLLFIMVFPFYLTQCETSSEYQKVKPVINGKKVILTGTIEGKPNADPVSIQVLRSNSQHVLKPNQKGHFTDTIPLAKPSYIQIVNKGQSAYGFLKPGDSLNLSFQNNELVNTLNFSGNSPRPSNYLVAKQLFADTIGPQNRREQRQKYTQKPSAFAKLLDSLKNQYKSFYQSYFKDQLPSKAFHNLEQANLNYKFYRQKQQYPNNHRRLTTGRYPDLPAGFKDYKDEIFMKSSRLFAVPAYQQYLRYIVNNKAQQRIEENQDKARTVIVRNVVEATIPNDTLKARVLGRFLLQSLKTNGPASVQGILAYYRQLPHSQGMMNQIDKYLSRWKRIAEGQPAPGFAYPTIGGDTVSLADLKGSYVYIDVWATWCKPCIQQIPYLKTLQQAYKPKDVRFVSISLDQTRKQNKWRRFVKKRDLGGIQLFANGEGFNSSFAQSYVVNSIPRFILIGPEEKIIDPMAQRPSGNIQVRLDSLLAN